MYTLSGQAQNSFGTYGTIGLNRIGVAYEIGMNFQKQAHNISLGARFYEPDLVFQKNYPGINLGYNYALRKGKKMKLLFGVNLGLFYENKITTNLWVFDPKIIAGAKWKLSDHLILQLTAGFGAVINKVETSYTSNIQTFNYLNYELALGLTYRFGNNSDQ